MATRFSLLFLTRNYRLNQNHFVTSPRKKGKSLFELRNPGDIEVLSQLRAGKPGAKGNGVAHGKPFL